MENYKNLYYYLFNQVTDALQALHDCNYGLAAQLLQQAQMECEERFLKDDDA